MNEKNILIVEDDKQLATALARTLRVGSNGKYKVDLCESGEMAYYRIKKRSYHLVVSNLNLSGINGVGLLSHVKANCHGTSTILMTENASEEINARSGQAAEGYLVKPFEMLDFLLMVQRVIDQRSKKNGFSKPISQESNKNGSILIMDDDANLCHIYSKVLKRSHFDVHQATTIQTAREFLQRNKYSIFICDIHMGRERGNDLVIEFKERLRENGTQVVMCSAYGQYRSLTEEMGADFFLEKPISLGTLLTLINRLMDNHHVSPPAREERSTRPQSMGLMNSNYLSKFRKE